MRGGGRSDAAATSLLHRLHGYAALVTQRHWEAERSTSTFLETGREAMFRGFPVRKAMAAAVAGAAVAVIAPSAMAGNRAVDPGLKVFQTAGCGACHTLAAGGGKGTVGPNLDNKKPTAALVTARVTAGKGVMPSFKGKLKAVEIKAVAAFVAANAGKKGAVAPAATTTKAATTTTKTTTSSSSSSSAPVSNAVTGDATAGKAVFAAQGCGQCHTLSAAGTSGTVGPNLDLAKPSISVIKTIVPAGATAGGAVMPQFSLSATDLDNLAAFIYTSTH